MTNGQWPPENMLARRVSEAQLSGQEIARSCWARNQGRQSLLEQLLLSQHVLNPCRDSVQVGKAVVVQVNLDSLVEFGSW